VGKRDSHVDASIERSAEFARPILNRIRRVVHAACPQVEEDLRWGHPAFLYKGILCGMASFKHHCAFVLWKGSLILDGSGRRADEGMGHFGRLTSVSDLPGDKTFLAYIRKAARLNDEGVKVPRTKPKKKALVVPRDFRSALQKNKKALSTFETFSTTNKRDYVEWVRDAKTPETRRRRLETSVAWMAEGKIRNWKYVRK